jgi:predicted secreted Zn-dependent protease
MCLCPQTELSSKHDESFDKLERAMHRALDQSLETLVAKAATEVKGSLHKDLDDVAQKLGLRQDYLQSRFDEMSAALDRKDLLAS